MISELIKPVIKVGNSAGVLLPREWLSGTAKVELLKKPIDLKKEILESIDNHLDDVMGVYIAGSYARGEETPNSDVDVLVVTNKTDTKIEKGKYNIILISKDNLEESLNDNILPILPMLLEAKAIINSGLLKKYSKITLTKKNLKYYVETTKSALEINKVLIEQDKANSSDCPDAVAYSLTLRFRSYYIVDCLMKGKSWSNRGLVRIVKDISGSKKAYEGYIRVKNKKKNMNELPANEAEKIYLYLERGLKKHIEWLAKRR